MATPGAGSLESVASTEDANTAVTDTADIQRPLDSTEAASAAATLERQLIKEGTLNFETHDITETRRHIACNSWRPHYSDGNR